MKGKQLSLWKDKSWKTWISIVSYGRNRGKFNVAYKHPAIHTPLFPVQSKIDRDGTESLSIPFFAIDLRNIFIMYLQQSPLIEIYTRSLGGQTVTNEFIGRFNLAAVHWTRLLHRP